MASKPFYNPKRNEWYLKYRPDPTGDWVRAKLGKHVGPVRLGVAPDPPKDIRKKAEEFADVEYRAKNGMGQAAARASPAASAKRREP